MKSKKTVLFPALLCLVAVVLSLAVYGVGEDTHAGTSVLISGFNSQSESLTVDDGAVISFERYSDLASGGTCARVTKEDGSASDETVTFVLDSTFDTPLDLRYYTNISFQFCSDYQDEEKTCELSLTVFSGEESVKYSRGCKTGVWQEVLFDISYVAFRDSITSLKIEAKLPADPDGEKNGFRIEDLTGNGYLDRDYYDSFAAGAYLNFAGDTVAAEDGYLKYSITEDVYLDANIPAFRKEEQNGILIELINKSNSRSLTFEYMTADDVDYSEEKTVNIQISPSEDSHIYYADIPGITDAVRWRISSRSGTGDIYFKTVAVVDLGTSGFEAKPGTTSSIAVGDDGKYLRVTGSIPSSVVAEYSGTKLGLYAVAAGDDFSAVGTGELTPIANIDISMKFNFKVPISTENETELSKKYAVAIIDVRDESGAPIFIGSPGFVSSYGTVLNTAEKEEKNRADGIISSDISDVTVNAAGFTVIDVDLGLLSKTDSSGEIYHTGRMYRYYSKEYLEVLDRKIRSLSCDGEVYLRLVMKNENCDTDYTLPGLAGEGAYSPILAHDETSAYNIYIVSEFLAARYNGGSNGKINGMILGYCSDETVQYGELPFSFGEYISTYADTLSVIFSGAVKENHSLKIFASVGDSLSLDGDRRFSVLFIDALTYEMKERGDCSWYIAVDSNADPLSGETDSFTAATVKSYSEYLLTVKNRHTASNDGVMYLWHPAAISDGAVDSYVYSMLTFSKSADVFRFAADINGGKDKSEYISVQKDGFFDSFKASDRLLSAFENDGAEPEELISVFESGRIATQRFDTQSQLDSGVIGEHDYFDFTALYSSGGWQAAENSPSISSIFLGGERRMSATFTSPGTGGYMGIMYKFEFPENMSIAPYISFDFEVPAEYGEAEILVIFGNGSVRAEYGFSLSGRETVICDLSQFAGNESITYIKILVLDQGQSYELNTYRITGHSKYYTNESLESVILQEREKVKNDLSEEEKISPMATAIGISALTVFTVAMILMLSRRKNENKK